MSRLNKSGQGGVALIMVLVILALISLIATQLVSVRNLYSHRTQNMLMADNAWGYAVGAESLAKIAIHQSLKNEDTVHLDQPWASQSVVFPIDGGQLMAAVQDLRSCFNLNTLAETGGATDSQNNFDKASPAQQVFRRLLILSAAKAGIDVDANILAARARDWLDADAMPTGFEGREDEEYTGYAQPYRTANQQITSISELRTISGFEPKLVDWLEPLVCVIPGNTDLTINVNTINEEQPQLLASFFEDLSVDEAASILASRPEDGFTEEDFDPLLPADAQLIKGASLSFSSDYFAALIEVDLGNTKTRLKSLLFYDRSKPAVQLLARMGHND